MSAPTCDVCDRPVGDQAYLCRRCLDALQRDLGDVTSITSTTIDRSDPRRPRPTTDDRPGTGETGLSLGLVDELQTALARQTAYRARVGGRSAERPTPYSTQASDIAWLLRNTLAGWTRLVVEERGPQLAGPVQDTLPSMSALLLRHATWLAHHRWAARAHDEITHAVGQARQHVDRPPDRVYAGPCGATHAGVECPDELWAKPKAATVACRTCGAEHDVPARRRWLLAAVEDQLAPAGQIAAAVTRLGEPVTPERIRTWAARGRLASKASTHQRPLYRVGDVLDLLAGEARRHAGNASA